MKTQKRIIALVLFAVMLFSLAACSKNDPTPSTDNTTAPSTTPAGDATTPSTDASTSDWAGPDWMNQTGMPIVKEGTEKTLSIYVEQTAEYGDFKESWMYKYITDFKPLSYISFLLSSVDTIVVVIASLCAKLSG